jgi:signal transduction histidine kinase
MFMSLAVCHELRNPLHVILAAVSFLRGNSTIAGVAAEDIAAISSSASHMQRLVNDVLDMSKLQAGTLHIIQEPVKCQALPVAAFK